MTEPTRTVWPTGTDYARSVQHPPTAFHDGALARAQTATNMLGMPLVASGQNAVVFLLRTTDGDQAIRCFTTPPTDGASRYEALHSHLQQHPAAAMTPTRWLDGGISVNEKRWPIVVMPWIEGQPLNLAVEDLVGQSHELLQLANEWVRIVLDLQQADVTHGDLQHGNVLLRDDYKFAFVDLDGAWVPSMKVGAPSESGHPNYQHPFRTAANWGRYGDSFPALLIETALRGLAADASLERFLSGENMLFSQADLVAPSNEVWKALAGSPDPEVVRLTAILKGLCAVSADRVMRPFGDLRAGAPESAVPRAPALNGSGPILRPLSIDTSNADWWGDEGGSDRTIVRQPHTIAPAVPAPAAAYAGNGSAQAAMFSPGAPIGVGPIAHPMITSVPPAGGTAAQKQAPSVHPRPSAEQRSSVQRSSVQPNVPQPNAQQAGGFDPSAPHERRGVGAVLGRNAIVAGALGGLSAGLLGSLLTGALRSALPVKAVPAVYVGGIALLLGGLLLSWQAFAAGAAKAGLRRLALGSALGVLIGVLTVFYANLLATNAGTNTHRAVNGHVVFTYSPLVLGGLWAMVACLVALVLGSLRSMRSALLGALGGAWAGFLGGLVYSGHAKWEGQVLLIRPLEPATLLVVLVICMVIGAVIGGTSRIASRARLRIIEGRLSGFETLLGSKKATIGASSRSTLVLTHDDKVAGKHVEIDLASRPPRANALRPVRVNGAEASGVFPLKDGDVLNVGHSFIRFETKLGGK